MAADLLRLDDRHSLRVAATGGGHRAEPVTASGKSWRRSVAGDGAGLAVLHRLRNRRAVEDGFRVTVMSWVAPDDESERAMGVDQTNESWVVGGRLVVKWMTGDLDGPHPGADRMRRLALAGFTEAPTLVGLVEWRNPSGDWGPVAVVQEYLPGAEDGWTWAVAEARRALGLDEGEAADFGGDLGELTGRMHLALAEDPVQRTSPDLAAAQAADARDALAEALRLTSAFDPSSHALLVAYHDRIASDLAALEGVVGSPAVPLHGDLHVGQVLRTPDDALHVIDFDGNPTRPSALRAAAGPTARDVAGMLLSLENAAGVAVHHARDVADPAALAWAARAWTGHVQGRFLSGYRRVLESRPDLYDDALLPAFDWEQVCREFVYAARHLPRWGYIPAAALRHRTRET